VRARPAHAPHPTPTGRPPRPSRSSSATHSSSVPSAVYSCWIGLVASSEWLLLSGPSPAASELIITRPRASTAAAAAAAAPALLPRTPPSLERCEARRAPRALPSCEERQQPAASMAPLLSDSRLAPARPPNSIAEKPLCRALPPPDEPAWSPPAAVLRRRPPEKGLPPAAMPPPSCQNLRPLPLLAPGAAAGAGSAGCRTCLAAMLLPGSSRGRKPRALTASTAAGGGATANSPGASAGCGCSALLLLLAPPSAPVIHAMSLCALSLLPCLSATHCCFSCCSCSALRLRSASTAAAAAGSVGPTNAIVTVSTSALTDPDATRPCHNSTHLVG
jgi:hypothetical protein